MGSHHWECSYRRSVGNDHLPNRHGHYFASVYGFGSGTNDNGSPLSIANCRDANRTQSFAYDSLNRIQNASTSGPNWGETYTIDAWGNMTAIGSYQSKPHESLNTTALKNNQLAAFTYDAAGNVILNGVSYTYDAENRLKNTARWVYTYDGDGKRVKKGASSCTTGTLYWTGVGSATLSESDLMGKMQKEYIFFNDARIARRDVCRPIAFTISLATVWAPPASSPIARAQRAKAPGA